MPATFNQSSWTIYIPKEMAGDTPNSPLSPSNEIATSVKPRSLLKNTALISTGALMVKQVINAARTEITATTGNEVLQTDINNALGALGIGVAIATGGFVAALAVGATAVIQGITAQRQLNRQNQAIAFNNKLRGKRVGISTGVYSG